jgi:UDP-glucose 4-epimerase
MNILIAGNLTSLASTLKKAFLREEYKVVCAGLYPNDSSIGLPDVTTHSVLPTDPAFRELLLGYKFDAVVYLATREEQLLSTTNQNSGQVLDGLLNTLGICHLVGTERLIYISSTEVYGTLADTSEQTDPQPASANGSILRIGEQYCRHYSQLHNLSTIVIRVPFIFGMDEQGSFLSRLLRDCREQEHLTFPAGPETPCSFLHAEDVADFILRALDVSVPGYQLVNLSSADPMTLRQLSELLKPSFQGVQFAFDETRTIFTRPAVVSRAKKVFDWLAVETISVGLPKLIALVDQELKPRPSFAERLRDKFPRYPVYLMWAELVLGALAMNLLVTISGSLVEFRYVDVRLIYVVIMGSLYGTRMGLSAAGLAGISVLLSWRQLGFDWTEVVYNVANWLPFAVYMTAGAITGYLQDKKENETSFQDEQNRLVEEKYSFLYGLYQEIRQIKDEYHHRLLGSRDSFGRIFNITRELDTLEEEEVLFRGLHILEDMMDNHTIAIYSINRALDFARLEIHSSALNAHLANSLDFAHLPDLVESIEKGQLFQNRKLLPNYPAYLAPIKNGDVPVAAVVIWETKFENSSLYYYNLLRVICGLMQASMNRAILFMNANIEASFMPSTRILRPVPFMKILRFQNKIAKQKMGEHLLVKLRPGGREARPQDWAGLYASISSVIRAVDYVGVLEDGSCYILFTQADASNAIHIYRRLEALGIGIELVEDSFEHLLPAEEIRPVHIDSTGGSISRE